MGSHVHPNCCKNAKFCGCNVEQRVFQEWLLITDDHGSFVNHSSTGYETKN
jgi:hypothetical protein